MWKVTASTSGLSLYISDIKEKVTIVQRTILESRIFPTVVCTIRFYQARYLLDEDDFDLEVRVNAEAHPKPEIGTYW